MQNKLLKELRNYLSRNSATLDQAINIENKLQILRTIKILVKPDFDLSSCSQEDLKAMLKMLAIFLAKDIIQLEED